MHLSQPINNVSAQSTAAALPTEPMTGHDFQGPCLFSKGPLLGGGVSGIVELLPNGHAIKTPWPGKDNLESQEDMRVEARAYTRLSEHLSAHPRFIKFIAFDEQNLTITMEFMSNGTLREYLQSNHSQILPSQRYLWIQAMAEGLGLLHALNILHCDLTPHNMLLDDKLELKIGDFGCCSIDASPSTAGTSARFYPSRASWRSPVTLDCDLFALGSCIYEVLTGAAPFQAMPSPQVRNLVKLQQFPDLTGLDFGPIIRDCWLLRAHSADSICSRIKEDLREKES